MQLGNVESTFRSNILGMFALTKYAVPHLKRGASIINTSSVTAFKAVPPWWTTPPPRELSSPSPAAWPCSLPRRVSASTSSALVRSSTSR